VYALALPQVDLGLAEDIVRAASEEEVFADTLFEGGDGGKEGGREGGV
jgi:hypothetical protein